MTGITMLLILFQACSTIEKASIHGLNRGEYNTLDGHTAKKVYVDVSEDKLEVYHQTGNKPEPTPYVVIPLNPADSPAIRTLKLRKKSLDIDITTIPLKYRPAFRGMRPQLTADINFALYAGWRHDHFRISSEADALGRYRHNIRNFGYDIGFFAGPGATAINPFTTANRTQNEYSGMIIQSGIAGFIESSFASFGLAAGFDHLLTADRRIWIYNQKP